MHIYSYPSIYNIGHRAVQSIFSENVYVQEKVDGSQISFGRKDGVLQIRSKNNDITDNTPKMFQQAVSVIKGLDLLDGYIYRGEYLSKLKHNTLTYARIPDGYIALFDICSTEIKEDYMPPAYVSLEAHRLGLSCVPNFYNGMVYDLRQLKEFMAQESFLGGPKIEGVVVKSPTLLNVDKKPMMAKLVSEAFKETHKTTWKHDNPTDGDFVQSLTKMYCTEARWRKAVQHLRERGELDDSPKDIGALIKEIPLDILGDSKDNIKEQLFSFFWPKIKRGVTKGFPEWYKNQLAESAFPCD